MDPVYILIRTSNRPEYFGRMMETIKSQTYKNIVTIVHSDDPRDDYIQGDIIIHGTAYGPQYGNGTYNLYNNKLLAAIPKDAPGWIHFIDDDDEYTAPDVIEKLVALSAKDHVNVARVIRWNKTVWPKHWEVQKSFQTECFFIHDSHRPKRAKWWANKGGDHHYSKQLTAVMPIHWIDNLIICKAQDGKGHGKKLDKGGARIDYSKKKTSEKLPCLCLQTIRKGQRKNWTRQGEMKWIDYDRASELEKIGAVKITHWHEYKAGRQPTPAIQLYKK